MADINKIIKDARNVLVGKVPDPQSQIDQITLALIYKFMDAKDTEAISLGIKPQFFIGENADYSFSEIMNATSNPKQYELYVKGIELLQHREDLPETFVNVFKDAFVPYKDASTLHLFLEEINKIPTDDTELLGTAFEDLLSIMGSQGDAGQFRTPRHIIDMIVEIIEPKKGETILDPACGTAGFLISAYNKINKQDLSIEEREKLINEGLVGYDINPNMVKLSHVNLFLHGCKKPNIHLYDTLTERDYWKDNFDVILANPPFMTPKGGIRPHELFSAINANRSEVLFTYYIAKHLRRDGRAGIIVPEGVIFQTGTAYKNLRRMLVEENYLYAVISLPAGVFNPYSGVKTSVLLFDRALAKRTDKILFVEMKNDGFDLGVQRRPIDKNDIPQIIETVKRFAFCISTESENDFVDESGLSIVVSKEEIAKQENDYILIKDRYLKKQLYKSQWPILKLSEVSNIITGYAFKSLELKTDKGEGYMPVIKIGNLIHKQELDLSDLQYVTYNDSLRKYIIKKGDILLAMTGATVGKVSYSQVDNLLLNQRVANIIANENLINKSYLKYILFSELFYSYCQKNAGGGAQGNISPNLLGRFEIPMPPISIQNEIVAKIDEKENDIKEYHEKILIEKNNIANIISNLWGVIDNEC